MTYVDDLDHSKRRLYVLLEREYHVKKILVTADPVSNPEKCVVLAIFGRDERLAFIRYAKDTTWTTIDLEEDRGQFHDVVQHKNHFYGVNEFNKLVCFDIPDEAGPVTVNVLTPRLDSEPCMVQRYLVKTPEGDLLQVARQKACEDFCWTIRFKVMRLDAGECSWTKVKSLGDVALFLGDNASIAVRASDFYGCQSDCIYFNQDKDPMDMIHHFGDFGIYEVGKKRFSSNLNINWSTLDRMPKRPLWILPSNVH